MDDTKDGDVQFHRHSLESGTDFVELLPFVARLVTDDDGEVVDHDVLTAEGDHVTNLV